MATQCTHAAYLHLLASLRQIKLLKGEFVHFFSSFKSVFKVTLISESPADCELCAEISFLSAKT